MLRRLGIVVMAAGLVTGQIVLTRVSERPEIQEGISSAIWNGSFLIGVGMNMTSAPIIWTLDGSSRKDEFHLSIPDAVNIRVGGFAGASDGTLVAAGRGVTGGARYGFVAIIPPGRGSNTILRTDSYTPQVVTIAPDGVIWTIGDQVEEKKSWCNVLKRFSPLGKLLSSEVLRVRGSPNVPPDAAEGSYLRSSRDRVGWLTKGGEYLEFSLDGRETNRFPAPPFWKEYAGVTNIALSDDFGVVAGAGNLRKAWTLDRMKRIWSPVQVSGDPFNSGLVFGFDGDQLVMGAYSKNQGFLVVHLSVAR